MTSRKPPLATLTALILATAVGCSFSASVGNPSSSDNSKGTSTSTAPVENASNEASFTNIVLTDNPETKESKTKFGPTTSKIYAFFDMSGMKEGDTIKGVWIAESATNAPPNYEIDQAILKITKDPKNGIVMNTGNFNMNKPNKGWPVGRYRVDMYINNTLKNSVKFDVEPDKVDDSGKP